MKRKFVSFLVVAMALVATDAINAQQIDPALTATIELQTLTLKDIHSKRKTTQEKIIAAETAVTVALDRVHEVENKMLTYLREAQSVMTNLYQIKRAAELVGVEIPKNITLLTNSVPSNIKGTAIAAVVSDQIRDVYAQMASLYPFMSQLVTSGSYNVINPSGETEAHKVNLLNSAERYYIANVVVSRLEKINIDIYILAYQVKTFSWMNLWYGLDPEGWAVVMSGRNIADMLIRKWNGLI